MRSHIEMQTQENIEAGMKPEEARYAALRQFGWVQSIKDACREQRGVSWIENLDQDLRYRPTDVVQESSLYCGGRAHSRLGHWREHSHFQRCGCGPVASARLS